MKKILIFVSLLFCILLGSSCNSTFNNAKKGIVDYYVCGLYLNLDSSTTFTYNDSNPKVHFNFDRAPDVIGIGTYQGSGTSFARFTDTARTINNKNGYLVCTGVASATLVGVDDLQNISIYEIDYQNGELVINSKISDTMKITSGSSYTYYSSFTTSNQKYKIKLTLKIN